MAKLASKETLKSLSQNIKETLKEVQCPIPELVKLHKLAIQSTKSNGTISSFITHIIDLSLGSYFIITEIISLLGSLIDTDIGYEKRFHMKWLNHGFVEGYKYFCNKKKKDIDGVWLQIKSEISMLKEHDFDSYLESIDKVLDEIKQNHFDKELRNSTAHFDDSQEEYNELQKCNDEDNIVRGVVSFISLHKKISKFCAILAETLFPVFLKENITTSLNETDNFNHFIMLSNENIFKAFNRNNQPNIFFNKKLTECSSELSNDNKYLLYISKMKNSLFSLGFEYKEYDVMRQIFLIKMSVDFMHADLTCAFKSYLHSENKIEQSFNLSRVELVEIPIITKLYGYNKSKQDSSLWTKLRKFDENFYDEKTEKIESKLNNIIKRFDNYNRNLNTHYHEGHKLNIVERYKEYNNQNHAEILLRCLNLIHFCKDMNVYLNHVLNQYKKEIDVEFEKMKYLRE